MRFMQGKSFDIRILKLNWIQHVDDPTDLCAHGSVFVRIADKIICDDKDGDGWTLSATALHLMRTLERNYCPGDFAGLLIPCCGFFMIANEMGDQVNLCGCPNGFDWIIKHEGNVVRHIADTGEQAVINWYNYLKLVLSFADKVQQFYHASTPKTLPSDDFDLNGYKAFWTEWQSLRNKGPQNLQLVI
ncbi:MAG: hypothetical protein M3142_13280 [Bacteroidota bacterium]|nr:hypothetical protein [Bacteroidota bacterium]